MRFLILFFLSFFLFQAIYSQDKLPSKWSDGEYPWYIVLSDEDKQKMENIWKEIGEDLKTDKNPFTGTFGQTGYEAGHFLRWSVNKGFIFIPYYDQSMIADFSYGKVKITKDSEIILSPDKELTGAGGRMAKTPNIWIPVINGEFIVPKSAIKSFGDYFGGFGEFNGFPRKVPCDGCGTFAKRMDEKVFNKTPQFLAPAAYEKFIKKPINGQIILTGKRWKTSNYEAAGYYESNSSALPVLVNVGKKHGVTKNLLFLLVDAGDNFYQVLKITRVRETTSEGVVYRVLDENGNETYHGDYDKKTKTFEKIPFPPIRVGMKITTSPIN